MIGNTFLTEIVDGKGITQPADVLSELRHRVIQSLKQTHDMTESKDGMDMSLLCFDDVARTVEYAGANNPMWMMRDGECIEYKADKRPIGYYRGEGLPFTNHRIEYKKGDTFYIFTDGFADQFGGEKGKKFRYKQLMDILVSIQKDPMLRQEEILNARFEDWKGRLDQIDDVLVIGVRV
jgi:sigma-B regulation protein RsbU (phosphoserine phosphatase)